MLAPLLTLAVVMIVGATLSFLVHHRNKGVAPRPMLTVPSGGYAILHLYGGCALREGAVQVDSDGKFDLIVHDGSAYRDPSVAAESDAPARTLPTYSFAFDQSPESGWLLYTCPKCARRWSQRNIPYCRCKHCADGHFHASTGCGFVWIVRERPDSQPAAVADDALRS